MTGPSSICSFIGRDTALRYEVAKVTNVTSYLWEAIKSTGEPETGVEFVTRTDSNSVLVKFKNNFKIGRAHV